ncbi:MAG TPA: hypothetical protein DEA27_03425, partial [Candidatus Moranbacteria bacterium]|nr:hypothetical protein [Candidatus Moranbacteria bacterium]
ISYVLAVLILFFAFFSWQSVDRAVFISGASDFFVPLIWFSLFFVCLGLAMLLIKEKLFLSIIFFLAISLNFFFVHNIFFLLSALIGLGLFYSAYASIQSDLLLSIKISAYKSVYRGAYPMVLALAVLISSQYFFSIKNIETKQLIPKLESNKVMDQVISFGFSKINPEFKNIETENLTVDQFLGEAFDMILKKQMENGENISEGKSLEEINMLLETQMGKELTQAEKEDVANFVETGKNPEQNLEMQAETKKIAIEQWKKELSNSAGIEIVGNEKVADVFLAMLNKKMDSFSEDNIGEARESSFFPAILAIILFFSIMSVGILVSKIWIPIVAVAVAVLRKFGIVEIVREMREVEVLK